MRIVVVVIVAVVVAGVGFVNVGSLGLINVVIMWFGRAGQSRLGDKPRGRFRHLK